MSVFLHQLLQSKSGKLYSNLGAFSFAFPLVDHALAVLGMAHPLAGPEGRPAACRLRLGRRLRKRELLAARGEEFSDVLNGIVLGSGVTAARLLPGRRVSTGACRRHALVFVLVTVMAPGVIVVAGGRSGAPGTGRTHIL